MAISSKPTSGPRHKGSSHESAVRHIPPLLNASRLPITNRRWNSAFRQKRLWDGADRLEEGQFAGGAEKFWQSRLVPISIRAF
jgi:hypothetical protein